MTDSQTISDSNNTVRNTFAAVAAVTAALALSTGSLEAAQVVAEPHVAAAQDAFFNTLIAVGYATAALGFTVGAATLYWWAKGADPVTDPLEFTINKLRGKKDDDVGPSP